MVPLGIGQAGQQPADMGTSGFEAMDQVIASYQVDSQQVFFPNAQPGS